MNNKGILRVKLLAILIIIGIFLFVGVPKGVEYFNNKSKDEYIEIVKKYIKEVKTNINSLSYKQIPNDKEAVLVKLDNLNTKGKSPYGSFKKEFSYVIVVNDNNHYDYYFAGIDSSMHGIPIIKESELNRESIVFGEENLSFINNVNSITNLYVGNTLFAKSSKSKEDDKNILLIPVSGELSVSYEFRSDVHKIYDNIVKNIDTSIYNKEAVINNGEIRYNNKIINKGYMTDINGLFRYMSFPSYDEKLYYASFVTSNNTYVAGVINKSGNYSSKNMIFDSMPTIVINEDAETVKENNKKYLMWNLMTLYPNNHNYTITECGAVIVKSTNNDKISLTMDTNSVMIGKSNNNCSLGDIFAIRKDNVKKGDKFIARGYVKYKDKSGNVYTTYSKNTVLGTVK